MSSSSCRYQSKLLKPLRSQSSSLQRLASSVATADVATRSRRIYHLGSSCDTYYRLSSFHATVLRKRCCANFSMIPIRFLQSGIHSNEFSANIIPESTDILASSGVDRSEEHSPGNIPTDVPGFTYITEGSATMSYAKNEEVFYNRVQMFNRDLSILVIREFITTREKELQQRYEKRIKRYQGQ